MNLRQQLIEYRAKLADASKYPEVPVYAKERVLENLDSLLATEDGEDFPARVTSFGAGAARFLYDQFSQGDLEDLMGDMPDP